MTDRMTEYVLCFVNKGDKILFIQKAKPKWQAGRFNLPGGKIETGENPHQAAYRELFEETNLRAKYIRHCGIIHGDGWLVNVMRCSVPYLDNLQQKTDEPVVWKRLVDALHFSPVIPNLRVIIPLLLCKVEGWLLKCDDTINDSLTIRLP